MKMAKTAKNILHGHQHLHLGVRPLSEGAGFSTLELLVAFAVLTLSITSVILVVFGNQSMSVDTELAQRALYLAEKNLEEAGASTLEDFDAISSDLTAVAFNSVYDTRVTVTDISECAKRITSESFWDRGFRSLDTGLTSIFISTEESGALEGDCVTSEITDEWDNPSVFVDENITGQSDTTSIDAVDDVIYLTTDPNAAAKDDFFVYDFDESGPTLTQLGTLNTDSTLSVGLYDVVVASSSQTEIYAFVASASTTAQLGVIDVSDPTNPTLLHQVGLPFVSPGGSYPEGRTVYYYDKRVYVGTKETDGPEFHVFDVSGLPLTPPAHLGSIELTHNVNDIMVRGDYAYLATSDNNHEIMVIDISNPATMVHPDTSDLGFDADGNDDGTAVFSTGSTVYLGRSYTSSGSNDNFIILDGPDVRDDTSTTDGQLGVKDVGLQNNSYTTGIVIRGKLAFLGLDDPTSGLIIYNITDPTDIELPAACSDFNFSENSVGLTMDGRYVFSANSSNAEIRIIEDLDATCPL